MDNLTLQQLLAAEWLAEEASTKYDAKHPSYECGYDVCWCHDPELFAGYWNDSDLAEFDNGTAQLVCEGCFDSCADYHYNTEDEPRC